MSLIAPENPTPAPDPSAPVLPQEDLFKRLGPAAVLGLIACFLPLLGSIVLYWKINIIGQWLRGHDTNGIVIYTAAFMVLAGAALLPTYASAILGGWAFGFQSGSVAALIGFTGAAAIGYAVGRAGSKDRVQAIISEKPKWKAIRNAMIGGSFLKSLAIISLVRLPINSPFAITNLVLASVKANPVAYILGTAIGMAPRTLITVYIAADFAQRLDPEQAANASKPTWVLVTGIVSAIAVMLVIGLIASNALKRLTKQPVHPVHPVDSVATVDAAQA